MKIDFKDGVIVQDSIPLDIEPIALQMRKADRDEIWASHRHEPMKTLTLAFYQSTLCWTVWHNGKRVAMFGVVPESLLGSHGSIWLLATKDFNKCYRKLIRYSRKFITYMLQHYPDLDNYVDARNYQSVKWLKHCGAEMEEAKPYGVDKIPFHHFSFKRKQVVYAD